MSRTPSTSTQEIQMDMFDHHPHTQVRERDTGERKCGDTYTKRRFKLFNMFTADDFNDGEAFPLWRINRLLRN